MFFDYYSGPVYSGGEGKFYIYKNPTKSEWNPFVASYARGWISPQGTLYVEGYEEKNTPSQIIHSDILKALLAKGVQGLTDEYVRSYFNYMELIYNVSKRGLLIQRIGQSDVIGFSESMDEDGVEMFPHLIQQAKELYMKVKMNCPYLSFRFWNE